MQIHYKLLIWIDVATLDEFRTVLFEPPIKRKHAVAVAPFRLPQQPELEQDESTFGVFHHRLVVSEGEIVARWPKGDVFIRTRRRRTSFWTALST